MSVLRPDDEAKALRYIYFGPVGMPLPPARPVAYPVFFGFVILGWFATWFVSPHGLVTLAGVALSVLVAPFVTRATMRLVDYYRPVSHYVTAARVEVRSPRPLLRRAPDYDYIAALEAEVGMTEPGGWITRADRERVLRGAGYVETALNPSIFV